MLSAGRIQFVTTVLLALLLRDGASAQAERGDVPRAAHRYDLSATLDADQARVHGTVRITFTNTSERALDALIFHLYLNAFRDERSVFMRESRGSMRGARATGPGHIALRSLQIDGRDVLAQSDSELLPDDFTQLRAPIEPPLAPGAVLTIESTFEVQLPPVFARSGHAPDFYAVAQWFPKLAKLEPDGHFEGFPYHALGEFYADFADYTLTLDAPADLQAVASGEQVEEKRMGARIVRRFAAPHVHDLAFVCGRGFRLEQRTLAGVKVRTLAPPGYEAAVAEHLRVIEAGLVHFGRQFGPYPYPGLSVVVPPRTAPGAAGMEYPTLIVTEGFWWPLGALPSATGAFVTAHELAHQWFYGLFASDELHAPVLDEGLAQWASLDLMRSLYGAREGLGPLAIDRFEAARFAAFTIARSTAPGLAASAYTASEYTASVYARASLVLESIRRAHGRERFERALAEYATRQRFRHPTLHDLGAAFDAVYGAGFSAHTLLPLLRDGSAASVQLRDASTKETRRGFATDVHAIRRGQVALPTVVALFAKDGRTLARMPWAADVTTLDATYETLEPVARVVLDPDRALLLDGDVADQVKTLAPAPREGTIARLSALAQLLASWVGP